MDIIDHKKAAEKFTEIMRKVHLNKEPILITNDSSQPVVVLSQQAYLDFTRTNLADLDAYDLFEGL